MPTAADVKALAFDPVGRWDAIPDLVIARLITTIGRLYADLTLCDEYSDLVAWHVAHMLAVTGVGAAGVVGPVSSTSISLGGASTSYAVAQVKVGGAVGSLDGRTIYGITAMALRDCIPTVGTGVH